MTNNKSKSKISYVLLLVAVLAFLFCLLFYFWQINKDIEETRAFVSEEVLKLRDFSDNMMNGLSFDDLDESQVSEWQNRIYSVVPRTQIAFVLKKDGALLFSSVKEMESLIPEFVGDSGKTAYNDLTLLWASTNSSNGELRFILLMNKMSTGILGDNNIPIIIFAAFILIIIGISLVCIARSNLHNLDNDDVASDEEEMHYLYQHELATTEEEYKPEEPLLEITPNVTEEIQNTPIMPQMNYVSRYTSYDTSVEDEAIREAMAEAAAVVGEELQRTKEHSVTVVEPRVVAPIEIEISPRIEEEKKDAPVLTGMEVAKQKRKTSPGSSTNKPGVKKTVEPVSVSSKKKSEDEDEIDIALDSKAKRIPSEVKKMIEETKGHITLTECAERLGVHHTYIWKVLKMIDNRSFQDYLEEYRLGEAKRLLLDTNMTVQQIADELGYTNAQNFIRFFSKVTGSTPGKFRKGITE